MASSGFDTCLPCGAIRKEGDTICRKCGFIDKTERRRIIDFLRAKVAPFIIFCTQMIYQLKKYHYEDKNSEKEILKVMDAFELAREDLHKDLRTAFVLIEPHFGSVWDLASEFEEYLKYFQECYKTIQDAKEQSDSRRSAFAVHDTPFPYYYFLESLELSFFENFKDFLNRHFSTESLLLVTAWWKTAKDLPKQAMNFDSQHASIVTPQPAAAAVALRPRKQYFLDSVEGQLAKMEKAAKEERKAKEDDDEDTGEEYDYEEEGEGWPYSRGPVKLRL